MAGSSFSYTSLDIFPKTLHEFRQRTQTGAIVSIICAVLCALLTTVEISEFVQVGTASPAFSRRSPTR